MKNYSIIAAVWVLLLGNASLAQAQQCVSLTRAMTIAAWGVHVNKYDQGDRSCSACTSSYPNGMPGATIPGPPKVSGECSSYDCSSFTTWILRQIPGQTAVPAAPAGPPNTYAMWGSQSAGPQTASSRAGYSPSGWAPCDPTKQPVCVGLTEWGEGGMGGPGHVVTALCGKVYSASPPIYDHYATPQPGTQQGSGSHLIVWLTPPGLKSLGMNSCSAQCTSTSASAYSATPMGLGGANPAVATAMPSSSGSSSQSGSSSDMMSQMMPMMMMSMMMSQMMSMMNQSGGKGSSGGTGASSGSGASSGGSSGGLAGLLNGALGGGSSGSGSSSANASSSPVGILQTLVSTVVSRLTTALAALFDAPGAATATASAGPATSTTTVLQQLQQLEEQQQLADQAAGGPETSASAVVSQSDAAAAAPVNPTQDWHQGSSGGWHRDHRLSCGVTAGSGKTVAGCRTAQ